MKRNRDNVLSKKCIKLNSSLFDTVPLELIFDIIKYMDVQTDINSFIYSIKHIRTKFENDETWQLMLYQNITDPIINKKILWKDNYYNNMNLSNKYNLKVIATNDDKTDYHIISVSDNMMIKMLKNLEDLNKSLIEYRDLLYEEKKDTEYVKLYVGNDPSAKILFLEIFSYQRESIQRFINDKTAESIEFIKVFDQIDEIVTYTNYEHNNYNNRICIYSNILTTQDIIIFILNKYNRLLINKDISPVFTYRYKDCNVLGYQLESLED